MGTDNTAVTQLRSQADHIEGNGARAFSLLLEKLGHTRESFHALPLEEKIAVTATLKKAFATLHGEQVSWAQFREIIGLEQWVDLRHLVAFSRTLCSILAPEERRATFSEQVSSHIDLDQVQRVLEREHDVYPARIDTDIRNQSGLFYRAIVELVSNAIDALAEQQNQIGRFGVGFYQILNHLQTESDRIILRTKRADEEAGIEIAFRKHAGQIECRISPLSTDFVHGTTIEVQAQHLNTAAVEEILRSTFKYNNTAIIELNGQRIEHWTPTGGTTRTSDGRSSATIVVDTAPGLVLVKDRGIGMSPTVVFEKLLVPKISGKPAITEQAHLCNTQAAVSWCTERITSHKQALVALQVGGVLIETITVPGAITADILVIDLPPHTILAEQRDQIAVDHITVSALRTVVDFVCEQPPSIERDAVINTLFGALEVLQGRSTLASRDANIVLYARARITEAYAEHDILPNDPQFLHLVCDGPHRALLATTIARQDLRTIPGIRMIENFTSSGEIELYQATFNADSERYLIVSDREIILSETIDVHDCAELISLLVSQAITDGYGEIAALPTTSTVHHDRRADDEFVSWASANHILLGFPHPLLARAEAAWIAERAPEIAAHFHDAILTKLASPALADGWGMLRDLAIENDPSTAHRVITTLAQSLEALGAHEKLRGILHSLPISPLSFFLLKGSDRPPHLRGATLEFREIEGQRYYELPRRDSYGNSKSYAALSGDTVHYQRSNGVVFEGKGVTVYSDGTISAGHSTSLAVPLPTLAPWGELRVTFFSSELPPARAEVKKQPSSTSALITRGNIRDAAGRQITCKHDQVTIDGEKLPHSLEAVGLLLLSSGDVLIIRQSPRSDSSLKRRESVKEEEHADYRDEYELLTADGKLLWRFDRAEWPTGVHGEPTRYQREWNNWAQKAVFCFPLQLSGPVDHDTPVIGVYSYALGYDRHQVLVGYVDASGRATVIQPNSPANQYSLDAWYLVRSSCGCCSAEQELTIRGLGQLEPQHTSTLEHFPTHKPLPVIIRSAFVPHPDGGWFAEASDDERRSGIAEFNSAGEFVAFTPHATESEWLIAEHRTHNSSPINLRSLSRLLLPRIPSQIINAVSAERRTGNSIEYELLKTIVKQYPAEFSTQNINSRTVTFTQTVWNTLRLNDAPALSVEHAKVLELFLLSQVSLDRQSTERLIFRAIQYRDLDIQHFERLLPCFYSFEYLHPALAEPAIALIVQRIAHLDIARQLPILSLLNDILPEGDPVRAGELAAKTIDFFEERFLTEPEETSERFSTRARSTIIDFNNGYTATLSTMIRYGSPVDVSELSEELRGFYLYATRPPHELAEDREADFSLPPGTSTVIMLSKITQWKRLCERSARTFNGSPEELAKEVALITAHTDDLSIKREVTHAIHFQTLDEPDLYLRELVQNSVDALAAMQLPQEQRRVEIRIFASSANNLQLEVVDPIGMSLHELLNYFLVPGESSKTDAELIGKFGQGLYTIFHDAREVCVKTGRGDGPTWYLRITPHRQDGFITDLSIECARTDEGYRGTTVIRNQSTRIPRVRAAEIRARVMTLIGGLDRRKALVTVQGMACNPESPILHEQLIPELGTLTILRNCNRALTQHGLFVSKLGRYDLPEYIWNLLESTGGVVVDLPVKVELTRSRRAIAAYETVKPVLERAIRRALVEVFLSELGEQLRRGHDEAFPFHALPYDYFVQPPRMYPLDTGVAQDAARIMAGQGIENIERYSAREGSRELIMLLCELPFVRLGHLSYSIRELRDRYQRSEYPFTSKEEKRTLPGSLRRMIEEQEQRHGGNGSGFSSIRQTYCSPDYQLEELLASVEPAVQEALTDKRELLTVLHSVSVALVALLDTHYKPGERPTTVAFYLSDDTSTAHAWRGGGIAWNINAVRSAVINGWRDIDYSDYHTFFKVSEFIRILVHEYAHTLEHYREWTHDQEFERKQAQALAVLLHQRGLQVLRQTFADVTATAQTQADAD